MLYKITILFFLRLLSDFLITIHFHFYSTILSYEEAEDDDDDDYQ